jgi:arylsulfatase A-like enzyme
VFPDLLEGAGYFIGFTGKGWGPGDFRHFGRKRNPAGKSFEGATLVPPTNGISNKDYAANFARFLRERPAADQPFCFWFGAHEPHRRYEPGSGLRAGKKLSDAIVPPYLPDNETVRSDLLDYALEIEWFDAQLGKILKQLDDAGEMENTLVLVTSDNGMPFPRVKGHIYEDACHEPLAVRWPGSGVKGGRRVADLVSFIDFAPTILEAAGVPQPQGTTGRSFLDVLKSDASAGPIDPSRNFVLLGRERCDVGRPGDAGYPVRAIRTKQYFYARNFAPDRWPAGNAETGFSDIDDSPTKRLIVASGPGDRFYDLALAKRGAEELYDLEKDPACAHNLADDPALTDAKGKLWNDLQTALRQQQDPRILGRGEVFDSYPSVAPRNRSWDAFMNRGKPATAATSQPAAE